jgi:predicted enzyme related to lactoylglutathione lyase
MSVIACILLEERDLRREFNLIYYQVSEIATLVERANSNGGKTYQPPFTVPDTGQIAVLADAQSAVFALFEPMQKR